MSILKKEVPVELAARVAEHQAKVSLASALDAANAACRKTKAAGLPAMQGQPGGDDPTGGWSGPVVWPAGIVAPTTGSGHQIVDLNYHSVAKKFFVTSVSGAG
jgi:hypothetical protein